MRLAKKEEDEARVFVRGCHLNEIELSIEHLRSLGTGTDPALPGGIIQKKLDSLDIHQNKAIFQSPLISFVAFHKT